MSETGAAVVERPAVQSVKKEPVKPPEKQEAKPELPRVSSLTELDELIRDEDPDSLFLRWTPDIEADRVQGTVSTNLGFLTPEAGISAHPFNPYPENGYGLNEKYRYAQHSVQKEELAKPGERRYYLLRGEPVRDENEQIVKGTDHEPLLIAESIIPLAEITPDATAEAYMRRLGHDAVRDYTTYPIPKPGEQMKKIRDVVADWAMAEASEYSRSVRDRTVQGIDNYLKAHSVAT